MEKRYVVSFLKTVTDSNGFDREIRQRIIEVLAACPEEAEQRGKDEFCRAEGFADWSIHADRVEVQEAEYPT